MDFGKVSVEDLEKIDFKLPEDMERNRSILEAGKGNLQLHVGLGTRGRGEWLGTIYPRGTDVKDYLHYYGHSFNAIEVSSTFYRVPPASDLLRWKSQVQPCFLFCPKFPQAITHLKRLTGVDTQAREFLDHVVCLGEKLGPVLLMPHPAMTVEHLPVILRFIESLPRGVKLFLELRHESFFNSGLPPQLLSFMQQYRVGLVIADTPGRRDVVHMQLTIPEVYVRFGGNQLHPTDYRRIDDWVLRLSEWKAKGLEQCYFFIHQDRGLYGPKLANYFLEQMNASYGTSFKLPVMQQQELF